MVLTQVIITPNLRFVGSTADFIKILEQSKFPIGLYWRLALSTNHSADPTKLKFVVMITWVNTIVQIKIHCHSNKH